MNTNLSQVNTAAYWRFRVENQRSEFDGNAAGVAMMTHADRELAAEVSGALRGAAG
jgi:hypothetical protein